MTEEQSTEKEKIQLPDITYNEFKNLPLQKLTPGTIVRNVNPAKLFASQPNTDSAKINIRMNNGIDSSNNLSPIVPGFIHELSREGGKNQRILVLGDNHHLTLQRWAQGEKVRVRIVGQLPENKKIYSFSTLRLNSGHPFRETS
jgi:hypothetical protein